MPESQKINYSGLTGPKYVNFCCDINSSLEDVFSIRVPFSQLDKDRFYNAAFKRNGNTLKINEVNLAEIVKAAKKHNDGRFGNNTYVCVSKNGKGVKR